MCVAGVVPRKGHALLIEALAGLAGRDWQLTCAGSLDRSPDTVAALRARIDGLGFADRVRLAGELESRHARRVLRPHRRRRCSRRIHEGYGMALAEALARGLPVVSTLAGAVRDTVPADAGLLVPVGDTAALRGALASVLDDAALRARLAAGARRARERLPTWPASCARLARALEDVALERLHG